MFQNIWRKMPKKLLDSDSDEGQVTFELKVNTGYARSYNDWRRKEELQKYKDRYGNTTNFMDIDDESNSDEEDETAEDLTEEAEKNFLVALSTLKSHNSEIYSKDFVLFNEKEDSAGIEESKKNHPAPIFLKDYERKVILEKHGILDDEEDDKTMEQHFSEHPESYAAEQRRLKESFKEALENSDFEDDDFLKKREKTEEEKVKILHNLFLKKPEKTEEEKVREEAEYVEWLKGQKEKLENEQDAASLKQLKEEWTNPDLDKDEQFLRDYILNRRYIEDTTGFDIPTYDEIVNETEAGLDQDEKELERQEDFERKYNFRFEEPDEEFIKSYPRTIKDSVRRQDNRRKEKREEVKERKAKEKQKLREELKEMRRLQEEEGRERLKKLQKEGGNSNIPIESLEGDFDPDQHDKLMAKCFGQNYYDQAVNEEGKPEFSDSGSEEDMADWDNWVPDDQELLQQQPSTSYEVKIRNYDEFMEDDQFIEEKQGKRRRRKSKFAEAVRRRKPIYDPNQDFEEYFDKYYGLKFEDFIEEKPCRFRYRNVPKNDFGLAVDEVLSAPDRELNAWASLKKAIQYRSDQEEKFDIQLFQKKSGNVEKKKRVIPSLFKPPEDSSEDSGSNEQSEKTSKIKTAKIEAETAAGGELTAEEMEDGVRKIKEKHEQTPQIKLEEKDNARKKKRRKSSQKYSSVENGEALLGIIHKLRDIFWSSLMEDLCEAEGPESFKKLKIFMSCLGFARESALGPNRHE